MQYLNQKQHGIPGIGVTANSGTIGVLGPGTYFAHIDDYFVSDSGVPITTLNPKYKSGTICYYWLSNPNTSYKIEYLVEITSKLEECSKQQFIDATKKVDPFVFETFKKATYNSNRLYLERLLDVVDMTNSGVDAEKYGDNLQKLISKKHKPNIALGATVNLSTTATIDNENKLYSDYTKPVYYDPLRNDKDSTTRVIHNGDNQYLFTTSLVDKDTNVISMGALGKWLDVVAKPNNSVRFLTPNDVKLKISNAYFKDSNIGNIESYSLFNNNNIYLDMDGNCYTLTDEDFDPSTYIFTIDTSKFFDDRKIKDNLHYGYIHTYWNYNDAGTIVIDTSYYHSSNIHNIDSSTIKIRVPNNSSTGGLIKDWDSIPKETPYEITEILASLYDVSSIKEVLGYENYESDLHGIIKTHEETIEFPVSSYVDVTSDYRNSSNGVLDISYFSGRDYVTDPSMNTIRLDMLDPSGFLYRHHDITQWVYSDKKIKFYSKHTFAHYDYYSNSFLISTEDLREELHEIKDPSVVEFKVSGMSPELSVGLVDIISNTPLYNAKVYFDGNKSGNYSWYSLNTTEEAIESIGTIGKITISARENLPGDSVSTISELLSQYSNETTLLDNILEHKIENTESRNGTASVVYNLKDDPTTYISSFNVILPGYTEARTIPKIDLIMHNLPEDIELLNKAKNGVLANLIQFFMDVSISDFDNSNWGKYSNIISNLGLDFTIKNYSHNTDFEDLYNKTQPVTRNTILATSDKDLGVNIYVDVIDLECDIYNSTMKEIEEHILPGYSSTFSSNSDAYKEYDKQDGGIQHDITLRFTNITIEQAAKGPFKVRILLEFDNPYELMLYYKFYISELKVHYDINKNTKTFNASKKVLTYLTKNEILRYTYESEKIETLISPLSYVLTPNSIQNPDEMRVKQTNINNFIGSKELVIIGLIPKHSEAEHYTEKEIIDNNYNRWQSNVLKKSYLQDNIQNINVSPININYIKDKISVKDPNFFINPEFLCDDPDDITQTFVAITYNAALLLPKLYKDEVSFIYNNEYHLASKYNQLNNNTEIFIELEDSFPVRTPELLESMEYWNYEYKLSGLENDKVIEGHILPNGNGYNYLTSDFDSSVYDTTYSLEETKQLNNDLIFDNALVAELNYPNKTDIYEPDNDKLYRTLLYNIKWQYPIYLTDDINEVTTIIPYDIRRPNEYISNRSQKIYPYNLAYSLYPRSLYDAEHKINIITMLRCPTVCYDENYEMYNGAHCIGYDQNSDYNAAITSTLTPPLNYMY